MQTENDKVLAIISYLTPLGWIVSFVLYNNDSGKDKMMLTPFHLRQSLGLILIFLLIPLFSFLFSPVPFVGWLYSLLKNFLYLGNFILWVWGLWSAVNYRLVPVPFVGEWFQQLFKSL